MAQGPHVSIVAETVFNVAGFPVTNALLTTWIVMAFLAIVSLLITSNLKMRPGKVQAAAELIIGGLYNFFTALGGPHAKRFFPLIGSIFLFVVVSNWAGLLPGVGTVGFYEETVNEHAAAPAQAVVLAPNQAYAVTMEATAAAPGAEETHAAETTTTAAESETHETTGTEAAAGEEHKKFIPLFRGPTADLNTTLALGIIAFFAIQFFGFAAAGPGYLKKFLDFRSPIYFFVGILEIISDFSKILSFAFRLFGNIFAGEVLLAVMAFLLPFLLPIPFYALELFVGVIQGLVFAMLTSVFINIATSHAHDEHGHEAHA